MITMSDVWDRAMEVIQGRGRMLAAIAVPLLFLPAVAQAAASAYTTRQTPGMMAIVALVQIAATLLTLWGSLALVAACSDPATDRNRALAIGAARLPLAIGLTVLVIVALMIAAAPGFALLGAGLAKLVLASGGHGATLAPGDISPGAAAGFGLYMLLLGIVLLWLGARLALLSPVMVNERRGIGSFARSWALTRGRTWRLLGVIILAAIVLLVATGAAQAVVTLVFRLILGPDAVATATFLGGVAVALVSSGASVIGAAFVAQLYLATSGQGAAKVFQ